MKLSGLIGVFIFSIYASCMPLDSSYGNKISLQGLKYIKESLFNEMASLFGPFTNMYQDSTAGLKSQILADEFLILPQNLLSSEYFEKLGIEFFNKDSYSLNLNEKKVKIPRDFKSLFVFNTTQPLQFPDNLEHDLASFLDLSFPFNLPDYMNLVDYYLVLPKLYLSEKLSFQSNDTMKDLINYSSVFARGILSSTSSKFPLFKSVVAENKPTMVFMFTEADLNTFKNSKNPIMNLKNYLNPKSYFVSNFFDKFSQDWITNINYPSLVSSLFCTTNTQNLTESYCLQIHDNKDLHLLPAFSDFLPLINFDTQENAFRKREETVDAQAIRQVKNKLSILADKFNDVTYELAHEPKQAIERVDERLDEKAYGLYDKVDDKKDALVSGIEEAADMIKSKLNILKDDDYEEEEWVPYDPIEKRDISSEHSNTGIVLPLSLIRVNELPVETPRKSWFSQVPFNDIDALLHKRFSIFSEDKDCDKITWYNVFHRSIFGKPKFCMAD